jgi:two-component system, NtrC family, sensor kinase
VLYIRPTPMSTMVKIIADRNSYGPYRQPITWIIMLLTGFTYILAAKISMGLALPNSPNITPIWMPAPIAWATLYLGGNHLLPGISIANFTVNFLNLITTQSLEKAILMGGLQTCFSMGSTLIGATCLRQFFVGRILDRVRNVVIFALIGLMIPAITPTFSLIAMGTFGVIPWSLYGEIWKTWWIGDALSVIIGMPMLVSWRRFQWSKVVWARGMEFSALALGFGLLTTVTYYSDYPLQYLVLPGLLWAAIRLGDCSATLGVVLVTLMTVLITALGRGPFLRSSLNESLLLLQSFMATITLTTLLMLAMIAEKRKTQRDLAIVNQNLERRVRDRTNDLEKLLVELQQTQTQLIQSEKMNSLGQLVAGLAHEINNPISFIYGNLGYTKEYMANLFEIVTAYQNQYPQSNRLLDKMTEELELDYIQEDFPKMLNSMQNGADRIRQLILTLRNFSRLDEGGLKPVNLHDGLDSTLLVLNYRLSQLSNGLSVRLIKEYGDLPEIECYADELNQVFLHLLNNAIDHLETSAVSCPVIRITTQYHDKDEVEVRIWNDGLPIPIEVRSKMFNPFFTTKAIGQGSGLGLPISHRIIVDQHGGTLDYCSELGMGTTFYLRIPVKQSWVTPDVPKVASHGWSNPKIALDEEPESVSPEFQDV